jgi:WXG100 family type VII secretion target
MARTIKVDPAQLNSTATQVDSAAGEYRKLYAKLFTDVGGMRAAWQGVDNQAFTTQIEGFRQDFELMAQLMDEYSTFLKTAAKTYQQAQDEVVSQAQRLTN